MKKILFVCIENSNRSQMAEAFAKIHGKGRAAVFSAGSRPSGVVNRKAIEAMREVGYDLTSHKSKSIDNLLSSFPSEGQGWAAVITMGCGDACPFIPAQYREDWAIPDPKQLDKDGFRKVRDLIEHKVKILLSQL